MNKFYSEFKAIIETEDRNQTLNYVLDKLNRGEISIISLYEELLTPVLRNMDLTGDEKVDIWREHIRSSIVKTVIENCFPYVIKERDAKYGVLSKKRVSIICPAEEYHEIGARMVADYFTLLGYQATFVGNNTPKEVFIKGIETENLDYVAISISNPYHLVSARNTIELIRKINKEIKIIVGGNAMLKLGEKAEKLDADYYMNTFDDIIAITGGETNETTI